MATFRCRNCGAVRDFKGNVRLNIQYDPTIHDPFHATCLRCGQKKAFEVYSGPMKEVVLGKEDAEKEILVLRHNALVEQLEAVERTKALQRRAYEEGGTREEMYVAERNIKLCTDVIVSVTGEIKALQRKINQFDFEREGIAKGAGAVYTAANNVQATSKKNKLYIGSRQFVSQHARSGLKNKRILDVNVWSWGLNLAWVEGGIQAKAQFKLKLDDSTPYHTIPQPVLEKLEHDPGMHPDAFLKLCREEGAGSLLWYDLGRENRPTWTALEIAALLRSGYRFKFLARKGSKHKGETKIVMEP
jgi:hypothetical protein